MEGSVGMSSKGTRISFFVRLPLLPSGSEEPVPAKPATAKAAKPKSKSKKNKCKNRHKVLVVDDVLVCVFVFLRYIYFLCFFFSV